MKRNRVRPILALLAALLGLVSLSGLTFSRMQEKPGNAEADEVLQVELHWEGQEKAGSIPVLGKQSVVSRRLYVENTGDLPCYVRIKLHIPEMGDASIFELGELSGEDFFPKEGQASAAKEYWEKKGEYFYYRNVQTQNLLQPGGRTRPVFSALRVTPSLREMPASQMELEVTAWAQAAKPEAGLDECQIWDRKVPQA